MPRLATCTKKTCEGALEDRQLTLLKHQPAFLCFILWTSTFWLLLLENTEKPKAPSLYTWGN